MSKLAQKYGVRLRFNPHYHPQANPTERVNRVLKTMLQSYVEENYRKWDMHLSELGCAVGTAKHEVTGQTPYMINFGKEVCLHVKEYENTLIEANSDNEHDTVVVPSLHRLRKRS